MARSADLAAVSCFEKCIYRRQRETETKKKTGCHPPGFYRADSNIQRFHFKASPGQYSLYQYIRYYGWRILLFATAPIFRERIVVIRQRSGVRAGDFGTEEIYSE